MEKAIIKNDESVKQYGLVNGMEVTIIKRMELTLLIECELGIFQINPEVLGG